VVEGYSSYTKMNKETNKVSPNFEGGDSSYVTPEVINNKRGEHLFEFLDSTLIGVFSGDLPKVRIVKEIITNHLFFTIFTRESQELRLISLYEFISIVNLTLFFVSMFCNLSSQRDNGTCSGFTDSQTCEEKKSLFDVDKLMCQWNGNECSFNSNVISFYSAVLVTFLTMLVIFPVRVLLTLIFSVFRAPTQEFIQHELNPNPNPNRSLSSHKQNINTSVAVSKSMVIPESVKRSRKLIVSATFTNPNSNPNPNPNPSAVDIEKGENIASPFLPISNRVGTMPIIDKNIGSTIDPRLEKIASSDIRPVNVVDSILKLIIQNKDGINLLQHISVDEFLSQWTIDDNFFWQNKDNIIERVSHNIEIARNQYNDMKSQPDTIRGIILFRYFIWDLLGSHSLAAKVFLNKTGISF
jgi:hypothetical protein